MEHFYRRACHKEAVRLPVQADRKAAAPQVDERLILRISLQNAGHHTGGGSGSAGPGLSADRRFTAPTPMIALVFV